MKCLKCKEYMQYEDLGDYDCPKPCYICMECGNTLRVFYSREPIMVKLTPRDLINITTGEDSDFCDGSTWIRVRMED